MYIILYFYIFFSFCAVFFLDNQIRMKIDTHRNIQHFPIFIDALEELATEELDTHYRKNKPEHETDEEHVEYTRYRIHQRVHYDL